MPLYSMGTSANSARRQNESVYQRTEVPIHSFTRKMQVPQFYLMNTLRKTVEAIQTDMEYLQGP